MRSKEMRKIQAELTPRLIGCDPNGTSRHPHTRRTSLLLMLPAFALGFYTCFPPHDEQNFAISGSLVPQKIQNLNSLASSLVFSL
jgi:hypothetical protein